MDYFYLPNLDLDKAYCLLPREESRHIVRVLRKSVGDEILLVDGKGAFVEGVIANADLKSCEVKILSVKQKNEERPYSLRLCVAPTKNISRYEWLLEKATEIGVDEIVPLLTFHSERRRINQERLNKILISAMKQSQKAYLPTLVNPMQFKDFLALETESKFKYIAHCNSSLEREALSQSYEKGASVDLLIGPEGDFSEEEIDLAQKQGYQGIHLGASRLRTETAAVVACANIYQLNF